MAIIRRTAAWCGLLILFAAWLMPGAARAAPSLACGGLTARDVVLEGGASVVSFLPTRNDTGVFLPPGTTVPITGLPPFCRVQITASSNGNPLQSLIAIEVWLPEQNWNGRFIGTGNGGFAGALDYRALSTRLLEGFAAANTDLGTGLRFACNALYCGSQAKRGGIPGGLYGDPQAIRDFGYAAIHLMTVAGKAVTGTFYGQRASHNYFAGCSTGGQNAFAEAQRFPDDYDGILAGAPAHNRTRLHASGWPGYARTHTGDGALTDAALGLVHARVLAQCAGRDGGLASDGFLQLPYSCSTDAKALVCRAAPGEVPCTDPTAATCTCLTERQAVAVNGFWNGPRDDLGRKGFPGFAHGAERPVPLTLANGFVGNLGPSWAQAEPEPPFDSLFYWIAGPNLNWRNYVLPRGNDFVGSSRALDEADRAPVDFSTFAQVLNATDTNLRPFARHGGRMLLYHGYSDPLIPSAVAINYYSAVFEQDPFRVNDYLRLFMAPGLDHCSGGPGANTFGATSQALPPQPLDPRDDALGALMAWVEQGRGPERIVATKYINDTRAQGVAFQRPLCQYPLHAAYAGGDPTAAASFRCVPSLPVLNQFNDPHWGY